MVRGQEVRVKVRRGGRSQWAEAPGAKFVAVIPGDAAGFRRKASVGIGDVAYLDEFGGFLAEQPTFDSPDSAKGALKERCGCLNVPASVFMFYRDRWWHLRTTWVPPAFEPLRWFKPNVL